MSWMHADQLDILWGIVQPPVPLMDTSGTTTIAQASTLRAETIPTSAEPTGDEDESAIHLDGRSSGPTNGVATRLRSTEASSPGANMTRSLPKRKSKGRPRKTLRKGNLPDEEDANKSRLQHHERQKLEPRPTQSAPRRSSRIAAKTSSAKINTLPDLAPTRKRKRAHTCDQASTDVSRTTFALTATKKRRI
ncbi:hypothetical protein EJ05DRAFT_136160 [Pseudovirgaria hyperparasitica]|uniref:Uncharacterized protein n=1 Tax=Pseudovirgaria hyperparasitica TaxID=470096 RepID=A0A6A6VYU0_9PEZI|nr:uncharacterized protein EJ05DRAFT_136160 [Pseudovirgaria hyperparasitica]KAF2754850.1 hypothetical protein EJ05DRAFT_136160 [Pseudovirgaria hyperparasitica]